ncbi:MAG: hypothetical protein LBH20_01560 [Treponema sp.]|jgi:hypothetical protein|nr:hypothetical protein [Treponema sp.]
MTKSGIVKLSVMVMALALILGLNACGGDNPAPKKSGDATLKSITIAGTALTTADLPLPISQSAWAAAMEEDALSDLDLDQTVEVALGGAVELDDASVVAVTTNNNAKVALATGRGLNLPEDDFANTQSIDLINNQYLYVRVTSENGNTTNYYRFRTVRATSITYLSSLEIAEKTIDGIGNDKSSIVSWQAAQAIGANIDKNIATTAKVAAGSPNPTATFQYALVKKPGTAEPAFGNTDTFDFEDGDVLYVKVTTADGESSRYYKFSILIGWDASLKTVRFGTTTSVMGNIYDVDELGTPASTLAGIAAPGYGYILATVKQPNNGFYVNVIANDPNATVEFGLADSAESTWSTGITDAGTGINKHKQKVILFDEDADDAFLAIKVISDNGEVTNYYKISVELWKTMIIHYGTPSLTNPADATDDKYIDPIWDTLSWIPVARQNRAESTEEFYDNPNTSGRAKLYWDEEGLWLYVDVTGPMTTEGWNDVTSDAHNYSSVELFINEAYPTVTTGNHSTTGGQYRVGTNGYVSGDPGAAITAFNNLGAKNTFATDDGYVIIMRAPWRFTGTYPLADEKLIALEIQINAVGPDGRRIAVLKWYNTTTNTYQNAAALAEAKLLLDGNTMGAQRPAITAQPAAQSMYDNAMNIVPFTVTAVSPDGGTLSYQWYTNTTNSYTGGTAVGTDSASYTPTDSAIGSYFYWVVVTNTASGASKSIDSAIASLTIRDSGTVAVDIELVTSSHANWDAGENAVVFDNGATTIAQYATVASFSIPATFDITKYVRLEFDCVSTDAAGVVLPNDQQYANVIFPEMFKGDGTSLSNFGYNAGAGGALVWSITGGVFSTADFSGGQGKIDVKVKGTATAKVIIKSVKLIAE